MRDLLQTDFDIHCYNNQRFHQGLIWHYDHYPQDICDSLITARYSMMHIKTITDDLKVAYHFDITFTLNIILLNNI